MTSSEWAFECTLFCTYSNEVSGSLHVADNEPTDFPQISTSALRAVPLVPLPADDGSGRPAHLPQADVRAQHPLPSSRLQAGVSRPPVRAPGHDGGASTPHIPRHHDDQTGAEGLHLRLR